MTIQIISVMASFTNCSLIFIFQLRFSRHSPRSIYVFRHFFKYSTFFLTNTIEVVQAKMEFISLVYWEYYNVMFWFGQFKSLLIKVNFNYFTHIIE